MLEQDLDDADVGATLQQVGGERVAQRVAGCRLGDAGDDNEGACAIVRNIELGPAAVQPNAALAFGELGFRPSAVHQHDCRTIGEAELTKLFAGDIETFNRYERRLIGGKW